MKDNRIVYGAGCVWWDSIDKAGNLNACTDTKLTNTYGLPCCPHCGSVLFEVDENEWYKNIDEYDKTHPGYKDLVKWMRGKCFKTLELARNEYEKTNKNS